MDRDQLVMDNMGLARKVVVKFLPIIHERGLDANDYVQVAVLKMTQIASGYDPSKGTFSTYAYDPMEKDVRFAINRDMTIGSYKKWMNASDKKDSPTKIEARKHVGKRAAKVSGVITNKDASVVYKVIRREYVDAVRAALGAISPRERDILMSWYTSDGYDTSQPHVTHGISRERVRQIREASFKKMTVALSRFGADFAIDD